MNLTNLLGIIAGTFTTIAFLPQVVRTWRTKSAEDLSLPTFSLFFTGVCLWLVYGLIRDDLPIILSNIVTLVLSGIVLGLMLVYRRRDRARRAPVKPG